MIQHAVLLALRSFWRKHVNACAISIRKRPDTTGTVLHISMCETQLLRAILLHDSLTEWQKQINQYTSMHLASRPIKII